MSGFTKEQMAMAKELQASFGSKGSQGLHGSHGSQPTRSGSAQKVGRTSVPPPAVRPPPTARPAISAAWAALSTSNGLVRPLLTRASVSSSAAASNPTVKPVTKPAPVHTVPKPAPKPISTPAPVQAPAQPTPKTAPKQELKQAPVQPATQPASKPANPPAPAKPNPQPVSTTAPPVQAPPKPAPIDLMSMEPLGQISIPTLVAQPASRCPEVKMGGCDASPQVQHVSSTAPEVEMAQNSGKGVKVSEDVLKVIKINKMGKSVIWNYMTEEPAIREPSAEELEEMKPLPPPDNTRWVRPWHIDAPLATGPNGQAAQGSSSSKTPKPIIGLKGSRHSR